MVQLIRNRQTGGAGAYHSHPLAAADGGNSGRNPALPEAHLDDGQLVIVDGDAFSQHPAGAGGLAESGADPAREFGEIVGLCQTGKGLLPVAVVDFIIPFRNQIVQWTAAEHAAEVCAGLAEGHAAVHAPGGLLLPLLQIQRRMKFLEGLDSLQRLHRSVHFSGEL